jgi:hypothetical protein
MMENYSIRYVLLKTSQHESDVTNEAHILLKEGVRSSKPFNTHFPQTVDREVIPSSLLDSTRPPKPRSMNSIQLSKSSPDLDLTALVQLVDVSQTRLLAEAIYHLNQQANRFQLRGKCQELVDEWEDGMLNGDGGEEGWLAAIRPVDLGMAINRVRGLKVM